MSGLGAGSTADAGISKQLSHMYRGLTIWLAAEAGNAYGKLEILEINEKLLKR